MTKPKAREQTRPTRPTHTIPLFSQLNVWSGSPVQPSTNPTGPERNSPRTSAPRDLEALARCLPVLVGRASPILRLPGGQADCAPAERVGDALGPALRALRVLGVLRRTHRTEALALLATFVHAGPERRERGWHEAIELALRSREDRLRSLRTPTQVPGKGPAAKSAAAEGQALLARSCDLYDRVARGESFVSSEPAHDRRSARVDGEWLSADLDTITRALAAEASDRRMVASERIAAKRRPATTAKARPACIDQRFRCEIPGDCARRECGGRVNMRHAARRCNRSHCRPWQVERAETVDRCQMKGVDRCHVNAQNAQLHKVNAQVG